MPSGKKEKPIYSVYCDDEFLVVGTAEECARYLGVKRDSFYTYIRRKRRNLDIMRVDLEDKEGLGLTLREYIQLNDCSSHRITVLAGVDYKVVQRALEKGTTASKKLLAWCEGLDVKIDKTDMTRPPTNRHWREKEDEDSSYLPVVLAAIRKGAKEIRVFSDENLKAIVGHFNEQGTKYEIVPFNVECVHVRIIR